MIRISVILAVVLAALSAPVYAASRGGIELPLQQDGLKLQGAGLLKKGFVFRVYLGALYLEESGDADRVLSNVPKRIDIYYFRHIPREYMLRAAHDALKKNLGDKKYAELLPGIEQIHEVFRDGEKGARASILYRPGEGLTYFYNDEPLITVAGDDLANAYFGVWLGEHAGSKTVKKAMLGHDG
ncbi:MAG TPA: chalcone isomerase family protein [Pontiella sp.]